MISVRWPKAESLHVLRQILDHAVHAVSRRPRWPTSLMNSSGAGGSDPITVHAKKLRLELLSVKKELERQRENLSLNYSAWTTHDHHAPGSWVVAQTPSSTHVRANLTTGYSDAAGVNTSTRFRSLALAR